MIYIMKPKHTTSAILDSGLIDIVDDLYSMLASNGYCVTTGVRLLASLAVGEVLHQFTKALLGAKWSVAALQYSISIVLAMSHLMAPSSKRKYYTRFQKLIISIWSSDLSRGAKSDLNQMAQLCVEWLGRYDDSSTSPKRSGVVRRSINQQRKLK